MASSSSNPAVQISDITIRSNKSKGSLESVDFSIGEERPNVHWDRNEDQAFQGTFTPSLDLSRSRPLTLHLRYRRRLLPNESQDITINAEELLLHASSLGEGETRQWRKAYGKAEVTIVLEKKSTEGEVQDVTNNHPGQRRKTTDSDMPLPSMTDEILRICPRFRILVIGKSGVGKSSLINKTFGVSQASVSHVDAGKANIEDEILSDDNQQFVLHDSRGFEAGEEGNLKIVTEFIDKRNKMPDIKDKLHAIWLCFAIPSAGGRIFETGVEDFLKLKVAGKLGTIPIIAIFTKYDQLITHADFQMDAALRQTLDQAQISEQLKKDADAALKKICIGPFEKHVKKKVPHITVSTREGYGDTLRDLIRLTFDNVREHVIGDASTVTAIAQRVNPGVNIDASIDVGKRKYWRGLASSVNFPGKTLRRCLEVIHVDIIKIWSFQDPHNHLYSKEFQALMLKMVDDVALQDPADPNRGLALGVSALGTLFTVSGPAAPIVLPIFATVVLAKWVYDIYNQSRDVLRRLMAYIVDLILFVQLLFSAVANNTRPISRRLIKITFAAYNDSITKIQVHSDIREHVARAGVFSGNRDSTLNKIIELIKQHHEGTDEMIKLRDQILAFQYPEIDEQWDVPTSTR